MALETHSTIATAERYKIRANRFSGPQVTDRMRERRRASVDYTVTSSLIRNLERMYGWPDEEMDSRGRKFTEEGKKVKKFTRQVKAAALQVSPTNSWKTHQRGIIV